MAYFHHLKKLAVGLMLLGVVAMGSSAYAVSQSPQEGHDYLVVSNGIDAARDRKADKVEVIEFFWYECPHCNDFEPILSAWVKKQNKNIEFKRIPVAFRDSFVPQQRLYYALEAMGKIEEMHKKIFSAIHEKKQVLSNEAAIVDFVAANGIDRKQFLDLYNSFTIQTRARRATQLQDVYKIEGVPVLVIANHYVTSPSIAGGFTGTLQVADWLIAKDKNAVTKTKGSDISASSKK